MNLSIEKVEFLKAVKKGPSRYSNDLTTYVSLITEKNAKILHKALLSKNASAYSYKNFEDLSVDLGAADEMIKYKYNVKEDFQDIREFLHPVIVTAGKDPSKCLGEKPSCSTRRNIDVESQLGQGIETSFSQRTKKYEFLFLVYFSCFMKRVKAERYKI